MGSVSLPVPILTLGKHEKNSLVMFPTKEFHNVRNQFFANILLMEQPTAFRYINKNVSYKTFFKKLYMLHRANLSGFLDTGL